MIKCATKKALHTFVGLYFLGHYRTLVAGFAKIYRWHCPEIATQKILSKNYLTLAGRMSNYFVPTLQGLKYFGMNEAGMIRK